MPIVLGAKFSLIINLREGVVGKVRSMPVNP